MFEEHELAIQGFLKHTPKCMSFVLETVVSYIMSQTIELLRVQPRFFRASMKLQASRRYLKYIIISTL
jgi:hypothetical protein